MKKLKRIWQSIAKRHASWLVFTCLVLSGNGLLCGQGVPVEVRDRAEQTSSNADPSVANSLAAEFGSSAQALDSSVVASELGFIQTLTGMTETSLILVGAILVGSVLISYNVLTAGKSGWGWMTVCVAVAAMVIVAKVGVSMFCEVSASNEISDWDEA